jgi:DNA-binding XRE family transcriptional regulator
MKDQLDTQMEALGAFIRARRKSANLTLRQLAERTRLSNPYLSQIERGLHQPSMRVIRLLSDALNVSAETLLTQAGLLHPAPAGSLTGSVPDAGPGAVTGPSGGPADQPGADTAVLKGTMGTVGVEAAIRGDQRLTAQQKSALVAVYRSMLTGG